VTVLVGKVFRIAVQWFLRHGRGGSQTPRPLRRVPAGSGMSRQVLMYQCTYVATGTCPPRSPLQSASRTRAASTAANNNKHSLHLVPTGSAGPGLLQSARPFPAGFAIALRVRAQCPPSSALPPSSPPFKGASYVENMSPAYS